jgi:hypothetical protein
MLVLILWLIVRAETPPQILNKPKITARLAIIIRAKEIVSKENLVLVRVKVFSCLKGIIVM